MVTARTYQSPLRDAQAALTRERILMAAMGYLEKHDIETLTLRHVAELSGGRRRRSMLTFRLWKRS